MAHSYPQFSDGDVEIHLTADVSDKLVLHSYVLSLHSTWFKASLSDRWATSGTTSTSSGNSLFGSSGRTLQDSGPCKWVYELRFEKNSSDGLLLRKNTTTIATAELLSNTAAPEVFDIDEFILKAQRNACVKAHKDMFGTLYHLSPAFSHESFDKARQSIQEVAKCAEKYGCEHVVKLHVENHLRLYKTEVLDMCASEPVDMLELAMSVKSEWIFMEAATNLLGRSKRYFDAVVPRLEEMGIAALMRLKRATLVETLRRCEYDMLCLQPSIMSAWPSQCAVYYFRQWLTEQLAASKGSGLCKGYAQLYHSIAADDFYDDHFIDIELWCQQLFTGGDNSGGNLRIYIDGVAARAATILKPILKDVTRRQDTKPDTHRSLRFMGVGDDELPWAKK